MKKAENSTLVNESVRLRQNLRRSSFGVDEIFRIYLGTSVVNNFRQDASMGGYVPHKEVVCKKKNYI